MIDIIKYEVQKAAETEQKLAMFHFQVLKYAVELNGYDSAVFCSEIGVPDTYRTEFRQMLALARVMREQGVTLS